MGQVLHIKRLPRVVTTALLLWLSSAAVSQASAAVAGVTVVLGYGATYQGPGGLAVHQGVDLSGSAGDEVRSFAEGEVSFAGRVPSAGGGSILCVTVRAGDDAVTVSPLERLKVARGDHVDVGTVLGTLAAQGDPSCDTTHVHISLRRRGVYIDPSGLLQAAAVPCAVPGEPASEPAAPVAPPAPPAAQPSPAGSPAAGASLAGQPAVVIGGEAEAAADAGSAPVAADQPLVAPGPAQTPVESPVAGSPARAQPGVSGAGSGVAAGAGQEGRERSARTSRGGLAPFVCGSRGSVTGDTGSAILGLRASAWSVDGKTGPVASSDLVRPTASGRSPVGSRAGAARLASVASSTASVFAAGGPLALAAVVVALFYIATRRVVECRLRVSQPVSDRFGSMLQHLRAGDTLCGLTSCSGLMPSQSRGRLAQRR